MSTGRSFFRIHKATLIATAVLSLAVMSIQFIPTKSDDYEIMAGSIHPDRFFSAERHTLSEFGWPYAHEFHHNVYSYDFYEVENAVLADREAAKQFSNKRINPNNIYLSAEALRQHAPVLNELFQKTRGPLVHSKHSRIERLFLLNFLIWIAGIVAIAVLLETTLRIAERVRSTSRNPYATISPSDLRFSLLTFLIVTLSLAITLMLGLRPHEKEGFGVTDFNVTNPPDTFINFYSSREETRGWPWIHSRTSYSYGHDRIQLQSNSPELAEAKALPLAEGGIAVSELNQKAPTLLQILRTRAAANPRPSETEIDFSRVIPNALTCLSIAITAGLLAELLQRRRVKPTSEPATPPPLTSS